MYDDEYREKCKRLEDIIDDYWEYFGADFQAKVTKINEDYE